MWLRALLVAGALPVLIAQPAVMPGPLTSGDGFRPGAAYAAGQYDIQIGKDGVGQDGKSGRGGKPGKSGKAGKDGKDGKAGKPGGAGKPGMPGNGNGKPGKGKATKGKSGTSCQGKCRIPADVQKHLRWLHDLEPR